MAVFAALAARLGALEGLAMTAWNLDEYDY